MSDDDQQTTARITTPDRATFEELSAETAALREVSFDETNALTAAESNDLLSGTVLRAITPLERLRNYGAPSLSPEELLAIALGNQGGRQRKEAVASVALEYGIPFFLQRDYTSRRARRAFGEQTSYQLAAIVELTTRLATPATDERPILRSAEDAAKYVRPRACTWPEERVHALLFDNRGALITDAAIAKGTLDRATVAPRDIITQCLLAHASGVIVYHNHPGGDPTPSHDDIEFTRHLLTACRTMDVRLLDHLVIAVSGYTSLAGRGLITTGSL